MGEQAHIAGSPAMERERQVLDEASRKALARRLAGGTVLTYDLDGWVVEEYPDGKIKRLAPTGEFRAADFPYPGFTSPAR